MVEKRPVVGSFVLACNTGLGILAKSFYDGGVVDKVFVVDHAKYESHSSWYPDSSVCKSVREFIDCVDILLCFEVPNPSNSLDWSIVSSFKKKGKRVVLMPMYESTPFPIPPELSPDKWIFPSELDSDYYAKAGIIGDTLRVPVDVRPRQRTKVKKFIHNAGSIGSQSLDRNGTNLLIKALPYIKSDVEIVIRSRDFNLKVEDPRVTISTGDVPYEELWEDGDAFIFVESYNGLSLPLQEAYAAGMLVIAGDRFPINTWLPNEFLVEPDGITNYRYVYGNILKADYNEENLAGMIDRANGMDISEYSQKGISWGIRNSWEFLREEYLKVIQK